MPEEVVTPEVTPEAAPDAELTPEPQDGAGDLSLAELKALNEKFLKEKRAANREAQAVKKERDALAAEKAEKEKAEMSELERLQAQVKESQELLAAKDAAIAQGKREAAARDAEVASPYIAYAAAELAKEGSEVDPKEFFKDFKKIHPAMFAGNGGQTAEPSGTGGPDTAGAKPDSDAKRLEEIEAEITKIKTGKRNDQTEVRLFHLVNERKHIRYKLEGKGT
jgi:hypothetical protein